nr:hypothetical protein [uncultured Desulfobacter sp.]
MVEALNSIMKGMSLQNPSCSLCLVKGRKILFVSWKNENSTEQGKFSQRKKRAVDLQRYILYKNKWLQALPQEAGNIEKQNPAIMVFMFA